MNLKEFINYTINEYLNNVEDTSNQVYKNIKTINSNDKDALLNDAVNWCLNLIKFKLGILPKFNIKWGDSSDTFDDSITIKFKNPYHFKYPETFYDTVCHEFCHVIDNVYGSTSNKFGENIMRPISDSKEWKIISLSTAPTSYAKDSKDEDFAISLQYVLYDKLNELSEDRIQFFRNKFPKLK